MQKYKVEFIQSETLVVDVLAKDEAEAKLLAYNKLAEANNNGTAHYLVTGKETTIETIYDVTDTDDPFDAQ